MSGNSAKGSCVRFGKVSVQNLAKELLGSIVYGIQEEVLRRTLFEDGAIVHEDDPVRHFTGKAHFVGHDDHGNAFAGQFDHDVEHFLDCFRIKGRGGFVKKNDLGLAAQGAGNGNALLLAAGEGGGIDVGLFGKADHFQIVVGQLLGLLAALVEEFDGRKGEVSEDVQVGVEVELLEDHGGGAANKFGAVLLGELDAVDENLARGGQLKSVHAADSGRFSRSRRTDNDELFAFVDSKIDVLEDFIGTEKLVNMA